MTLSNDERMTVLQQLEAFASKATLSYQDQKELLAIDNIIMTDAAETIKQFGAELKDARAELRAASENLDGYKKLLAERTRKLTDQEGLNKVNVEQNRDLCKTIDMLREEVKSARVSAKAAYADCNRAESLAFECGRAEGKAQNGVPYLSAEALQLAEEQAFERGRKHGREVDAAFERGLGRDQVGGKEDLDRAVYAAWKKGSERGRKIGAASLARRLKSNDDAFARMIDNAIEQMPTSGVDVPPNPDAQRFETSFFSSQPNLQNLKKA